MNRWMRDPRVERAETDAFFAERAERAGDLSSARERYRAAAESFAAVSLSVPADHPNTRTDLAIAAVATFARGGSYPRAIDHARRVLAEPGALTESGRAELLRLLRAYEQDPR
ncbi:MAG: hypothetical protein U0324_23510 [Polyangiales bacterium]